MDGADLFHVRALAICKQTRRDEKILIITDQLPELTIARLNLSSTGLEILTHNKCLSAISLIMKERPGLILLDFMPPFTIEQEICFLIKKNRMITSTPILLYSSVNEKMLNKRAHELAVAGYIHKNWNYHRALRHLANFIHFRFNRSIDK